MGIHHKHSYKLGMLTSQQ